MLQFQDSRFNKVNDEQLEVGRMLFESKESWEKYENYIEEC